MFEGFSPEAVDFLWGIRFNNNKAWFAEHKQTYIKTLYEPMKALAAEVFEPLSSVPGLLCKVSRIYRDARMPNYAEAPYKQSLWFCIRRECFSWSQEPALFFEINPEGYMYGFTLLRPKAAVMTAFRTELAENPKPFLEIVSRIERATDFMVGGETYSRKKPCPLPELERFYSLKNVEAYRRYPADEELFSPALSSRVRDALQALLPLNEYLLRFIGQAE